MAPRLWTRVQDAECYNRPGTSSRILKLVKEVQSDKLNISTHIIIMYAVIIATGTSLHATVLTCMLVTGVIIQL